MYLHSDSLCLIPFFNAIGLTEVEKIIPMILLHVMTILIRLFFPDSKLSVRIIQSFMYCPFLLSKTTLSSSLIVALPVRIFDSFMYCHFLVSKMNFISCLIFILSAGIFDSFMNCFFCLSKLFFVVM